MLSSPPPALQGREWLHSHARQHAATKAAAAAAPLNEAAAPEVVWAEPAALQVGSEGMAQCRASWAAHSAEVKAQTQCVFLPGFCRCVYGRWHDTRLDT